MSGPNADIDAILAGLVVPVGRFSLDPATGSMIWSKPLYRMYGFVEGEIVPTADLMAAHRHPDDRDRVQALVVAAVADGEPFSCRHRIVDTAGKLHTVVVLGIADLGADGIVLLQGYVIDVSDIITHEVSALTQRALDSALEGRATIEQAKGALMLAYALDDVEAFALLRWHSQHANIKIRELARKVVEQLADEALAVLPPRRKIHQALESVVGPVDVIPPELANPMTAMLPTEPKEQIDRTAEESPTETRR